MTYELPPKERVNLISKRLINLRKVENRAPGPLQMAIKNTKLALRQAIEDQRKEWAHQ